MSFRYFNRFPRPIAKTAELYLYESLGEQQSWTPDVFSRQVDQYDHVWLTTYSEASATTELVGNVTTDAGPLSAPRGYLASFEDKVYLLRADYEVQNKEMIVELDWWLADLDLRPDATVFRNVFDCRGNVLGLGSGYPLGGMLLFSALPVGSKIHDIRHIPLDVLPDDNCYQVEVGFFHSDGTRMRAYAPDGSEYANRLFLIH